MRVAHCAGILLVAVAGCKSDLSLSDVQKELTLSPPLVDVGDVAVGQTVEAVFVLDNLAGGDIDVRRVEVFNQEGEAFSFEGELTVVERKSSLDLVLTYTPTSIGYHYATVTVVSDAKTSQLQADVRGRAVSQSVTVWPPMLDFGPVEVGSTATETLEVRNNTSLAATLDAFTIDHPDFTLTGIPGDLDPNDTTFLTVSYTATTEERAVAELLIDIGPVVVESVALHANDCETGIPDNYDQDGDGITVCADDCDDARDDVMPGALELPNGVDDDCDGTVDEGTTAYDDDGDGYCEAASCSDGSLPGDCNDGNVDVNPGQEEVSGNGIDDDCDGQADGGSSDGDGDGYAPSGDDCDDTDGTVYPGAPELDDGIDNDCDGAVDEGTASQDDDGDGYCDHPTSCLGTLLPGDCDDDPSGGDATYPGAPELPDWQDNDCDGSVDEGTENTDDDGDGYTETGGDCDDTDASLNPGQGNC